MGSDPLARVVARLYTVPPEGFVGARDEAVAQATSAGDRELAARIAKLRKPTVAAWLVNLLAHERPELVAELLALGDELRAAQRELRGNDLRELSQRRRESVGVLARQAVALALARGLRRGSLPVAEVEATLNAALAEPEVAEDVRAGRLTKAVVYDGFGETPRPALRLVHGGRAKPDADQRPTGKAERNERAERVGRGEQAEHVEHVEHVERAERVAARAAEQAARAQRRRERASAHRELMVARTELAEAEAARAAAESAVSAARRRVEHAAAVAAALDVEPMESGNAEQRG